MNTGKFNKQEDAKFAPGGAYSTPEKRETEAKPSDFLMPGERKYPYKVNGKVSTHLLKAAISRAVQNGHPDVAKKARALYEDHS